MGIKPLGTSDQAQQPTQGASNRRKVPGAGRAGTAFGRLDMREDFRGDGVTSVAQRCHESGSPRCVDVDVQRNFLRVAVGDRPLLR